MGNDDLQEVVRARFGHGDDKLDAIVAALTDIR
jgi:hypothetical protein